MKVEVVGRNGAKKIGAWMCRGEEGDRLGV